MQEHITRLKLHYLLKIPFVDIMAADRQLATEIEFDLRKFEEAQQEAERQRQQQLQRRRSSAAGGQGPSPLVCFLIYTGEK